MSDPTSQFDAWGESKPPKKAKSDSRKTGMVMIGGVFALMVCLLGLVAAWSFGVVRPEANRQIAEVRTENAYVTETQVADQQREVTATARVSITRTARAEAVIADREVAASTAQAQGIAPLPEWKLRLNETFDETRTVWNTGSGLLDGYDRRYTKTIENGHFHLELDDKAGDVNWRTKVPGVGYLYDGLISVEIQRLTGGRDVDYGFTFRESDEGYYFFSINQYEWALFRFDRPSDEWRLVLERTPITGSQSTHRLVVFMQGEQIDLYIDGRKVGSFEDTLSEVYLVQGLWLAVDAEGGEALKVSFDNLVVFSP